MAERFALGLGRGKKIVTNVREKGANAYRRTTVFVRRRPFASFFIALALLFLVMAANTFLAPKAQEVKKEPVVKSVAVYQIGSAPKTNILAQVEKSGVVQIVAQTPGIVGQINVFEGQQVGKGANLIQLSSNYSGGNAAGVGAAIAQEQYKQVVDTFDTQKDIIKKQREIAEKTDANSDALRDITNQSISDTQGVIDLNDSILSSLNANITNLEATNVGGVNDAAILQTKQLKSQFLSANSQLRMGLRNSQFQASGDKPPAALSDLQREITLRQLDIQEKSLNVNLEISRLQAAMAAINASMFHPVAPFAGTIERVHVQVGDLVNPGTILLTLAGNKQETTVVAKVPGKIARSLSQFEASTIYIDNTSVKVMPAFISQEATYGQLYSVIFTIPAEYQDKLTDGEFIRIEAPIGLPNTGSTVPFVPIDSVYQTQERAFVYVVSDNAAVAKEVKLGEVIGNDVEVESGLSSGDSVILNRNIIAGDKVTVGN